MTEERFEATLEAYRRQKWAEVEDVGIDALRRELAALENWLARVREGDGWHGEREMEVDLEFREAKARVLREVLAEVQSSEGG